jgi:hypothetical protein
VDKNLEKILQDCVNERKFFYLTNYASDQENLNPAVWAAVLPAACHLYSAFTVNEGRREELLSVLEYAKRAQSDVDTSEALRLLIADAEIPVAGSDGSNDWQSYTFLLSLAATAMDPLNNRELHGRLVQRAVELSDSPWGKYESISGLLESGKISRAQTETLVALAKKHLKGAKLKVVEKIVERRYRYNDFTD